jgi:hypothetical protein
VFIAYVVTAVLMSLLLLFSARGKLTRDPSIVTSMTTLEVPLGMLPFLAVCEIAGALGLIAGIWLAPLGVAAAVGVVLYFVGAVGAHLRKADYKGAPPAGVILLVSAGVLALGIAGL